MPFASHDDLLGRPSGPMIPMDEAGSGGRESETLVPDGTFVTFRSDPRKMGDLSARPNAFNTGRVKTLTPDNNERNFPREGGVRFDVEKERKKSYRTRGEAYKDIPYGDAKPVIGDPMWPAKQLFPYTPSVNQINKVEHDIVPASSRTSKRDSLVAPVDGDDSSRGFSPTKDMKGDLGMLRGMGSDFFNYGGPEASASGVDEHDLLTLVDWDDQTHDWQLGQAGTAKAVAVASVLASHIAKAAVAIAKKGGFKSKEEAIAWIERRADKIKTRRIKTLDAAITRAVKVATGLVLPHLNFAIRSGVSDYLGEDEADALGSFEWDNDSKGFEWRNLGAFKWSKKGKSFSWAPPVPSKSGSGMPGLPGLPGAGKMPGLPGLPGADLMPGLPGGIKMPGMPGMPSMPGMPGAGKMMPPMPSGTMPMMPSMPGRGRHGRGMPEMPSHGRGHPSMPSHGRGMPSMPSHGRGMPEMPNMPGPRHGRLHGGEYADGEDTSGWGSESNDTFAYIPNLGAGDDWKAGLVTSLDSPAGQAVTNAATAAVTSQVRSGELSTTEQIANAVSSAAKIAAQVYIAKKTPAPARPSMISTMATTILAPDQPLWKRPLFWVGAALLVGVGGFVALKGGGGKSGGRRKTTRRYRKNALLPFTAYSNRWKKSRKSRWA
jgi:hypothetical protein